MKTLSLLILALIVISNSFAQNKSIDEAKGLKVGTKAPIFSSPDAQPEEFDLSKSLEVGAVVLIFYRGAWCPYCNRHLSAIQEGLPLLYEKGVSVVAITPENPEYIEKMANQTGAKFTIVYDKDYTISKAYDVNFTPKQKQVNFYNKVMKANMQEAHNSEETNLPIPATYIINKDGIITWRHFDPNYKKRSSIEEILENIPR